MYTQIYDLFMSTVYGAVTVTPDMELVATLVATTACLFCFALPFMLVWKVIKLVCG